MRCATFMPILGLLAVLAASCGPPEHPGLKTTGLKQRGAPLPPLIYTFEPCAGSAATDPSARAFAALLLSLWDYDWTVKSMHKERRQVVATACLGSGSDHCVTVRFTARADGTVASDDLGRQPRNLHDDIERWMGNVRQAFGRYSCLADEVLKERLAGR